VKRFAVQIPPVVQAQITAQVLYIAEDSIDTALAWESRLRNAIESIGESPGHAIDEPTSERLGRLVHRFVFERTYLVDYVIDVPSRSVSIINFRHGATLR
jgi:plasmid stabilization system protein ParE